MKENILTLCLLFACFWVTTAVAQQPTLEWAKRYSGSGSSENTAVAIAVDELGNSYVTGTSYVTNSNVSKITTVKYSPSGQQLWVSQLEEVSTAVAIALDDKGGIYVTGTSGAFNSTTSDLITIRYDAETGQVSWATYYGDSDEEAKAMAVDNAGGVYVTGTSNNGTSSSIVTLRYNAATGNQSWVQEHRGSAGPYNFSAAVAVDNAGRVYVTGTSSSSSLLSCGFEGCPNTEFTTVAYDTSTGKEIWTHNYQRPKSNYSTAYAIATDNTGGVYVTGRSYGVSSVDFTTIRYGAETGKQDWVSHYNSPGSYYDAAIAVATDATGGVYVTGITGGFDTSNDMATIRYDAATGKQTWANHYVGPESDEPTAIAADNAGSVYITGYSDIGYLVNVTIRYDAATGHLIWSEPYVSSEESRGFAASDLALDNRGNVFITGTDSDWGGSADYLTIKYSQEATCPAMAEAAIRGNSTARVGTRRSTYSLSASSATSFTWSITSPDGSAYTAFSGQGTSSIKVDWPDQPEVYKVSVSYSAREGCPAREVVTYVHVFEEEAGFVTGGGWVDSPAKPAHELMRTASKAHWGLGARYKKGKTVQTQGTLLLLWESGGYVFRSTNVTEGSLVIAGNRAYYTGTGTLTCRDASGSVNADPRRLAYLVSAVDGDFKEGKSKKSRQPDRLRILVWELKNDGTRGSVLYDNQLACSSANLDLNAAACQPIGGGNITIHRKGIRSVSDLLATAAEESATQGLTAYPTAFSDRATVSFTPESDTEYELELYDLKGALVRKIDSGTAKANQRQVHELQAEGLQKGLYLVRLTTGTEVQIVKVVIQQ